MGGQGSRRSVLWPLADQGRVDPDVLVEEPELDAGRVATNDSLPQNDLLDLGTVLPDRAFHAHVDPSTAGQVDVEQVPHRARREELPEDVGIDVAGVEQQQLFELGQRADELQAEGSDVFDVDESELAQAGALAQLLTHRVVVVPSLEPENLQRP